MASYLGCGVPSVRSLRAGNAVMRREIVALLDGLARRLGNLAGLFGNRHYEDLRSECVRLREEIASISLETADSLRLLGEAGRSLHQIRTGLIQLTEVSRIEISWPAI